jgi:hypothetical protein
MAPLSYFDHTAVLIQILLSPIYLFMISALVSGARIIDAIFQPIWSATEWQPENHCFRALYAPFWLIFEAVAVILAIIFFIPPFPIIIAVGVVLEVFLFVPQIICFIQIWYNWTHNYKKLVGHKNSGVQGSSLLEEEQILQNKNALLE